MDSLDRRAQRRAYILAYQEVLVPTWYISKLLSPVTTTPRSQRVTCIERGSYVVTAVSVFTTPVAMASMPVSGIKQGYNSILTCAHELNELGE
jgi:hypothetical protein